MTDDTVVPTKNNPKTLKNKIVTAEAPREKKASVVFRW